jgi:AAA ATPase domain
MFCGRRGETKRIIESLSSGRNLILSGTFGIGRTSLVRHVAKTTQDKWKFLFADFSKNPDQVCRELEKQLKKGTFYKRPTLKGYKSRRRQILSLVSRDPTPHVFVLDNIAKLTAQKLSLIRYFVSAGSVLLVAITESFIDDDKLLALRIALLPVDQMILRRMQMLDSIEMIRAYAEGSNLSWLDEQLRTTAIITRGYPLGIVELMSRSRSRRDSDDD